MVLTVDNAADSDSATLTTTCVLTLLLTVTVDNADIIGLAQSTPT